jgi:hypothetical protein
MLKNKQPSRSFIAFLVTWAFVVLTVSGIVLYIVPQGRIAYWVQWSLLGLGKEAWGELHMLFGGVFIVTGFLHLYFNWKPFKNYLSARVAGHLKLKRELLYSLLATFLIGALSVLQLPPASWVFDLNAQIKDSWVSGPEAEPPFGHAEELSLAGFAKRQGIALPAALQSLRAQGLTIDSERDSLTRIARANGVTPADVYVLIKPLETPSSPVNAGVLWTEALIEERFAGKGIGRKTLAQIADMLGMRTERVQQALRQGDNPPAAEASLRELAEARGATPIELMQQLLIGNPNPAE